MSLSKLCDDSKGIIYKKDGTFDIMNEDLYNGKDYFRKMVISKNELMIAKILMKYPHPNIVEIYHVNDNYIDMEIIDNTLYEHLDITTLIKLKKDMEKVKDYLQSFGIIYIDWKIDNMGKSKVDGSFKLFDFDASGIITTHTGEWKELPPEMNSYRIATIENGMKKPIQIDNFSFVKGFLDAVEDFA